MSWTVLPCLVLTAWLLYMTGFVLACNTCTDVGVVGCCDFRSQILCGDTCQSKAGPVSSTCTTADISREFDIDLPTDQGEMYLDKNRNNQKDPCDPWVWVIRMRWGKAPRVSDGNCATYEVCFFKERDPNAADKDADKTGDYTLKNPEYEHITAIAVYGDPNEGEGPTPQSYIKANDGTKIYEGVDEAYKCVTTDGRILWTQSASGNTVTTKTGPETRVVTKDANGIVLSVETKRNPTIGWTYFNYQEDEGVLVRKRQTVQKFNSDGSNRFETTMWVYYGPDDPNYPGKLKFMVQPEGVVRYLEHENRFDEGVDPNDSGIDCGLDDANTATEANLQEFASLVHFSYDEEGRGTSLYTGGGCGGCGGGGKAGMYSYEYGRRIPIESIPEEIDYEYLYNTWETYRRKTDPSGLRTVEFFNACGSPMYEVVQQMSGDSITAKWITHSTYYDLWQYPKYLGRLEERRSPSACKGYGVSQSGGWVTSVDPNENGTDGLVQLYGYDANSGNQAWEKVRQGTESNEGANPEIWVRQTTYMQPDANQDIWLVDEETEYADANSDANMAEPRVTKHTYDEFYADGVTVEYETVEYPQVTSGHNPGNAGVRKVSYHYHLDTDPNHSLYYNDWTRREYSNEGDEPHYSYTELGTNLWNNGQVVRSIEDVDTDTVSLPSEWADNGQPDGAHLETTYEYYGSDANAASYGQIKSITAPDGQKSVYAYMCLREIGDGDPNDTETTTHLATLTAPLMVGNDYGDRPVSIQVSDMGGKTIVSAAGKSGSYNDGTTAGEGLLNDWASDGEIDDSFTAFFFGGAVLTSRTVNTYDPNTQKLMASARWTNADDTTDPNLVTSYSYDPNNGRQLSSTSADGVISYTVYDGLGRAVQSWIGTDANGATQDDPNDSGGNDLKLVSATFYDEATEGEGSSGVGDGLVTSTRQYYDDANSYQTINNYDYRGRLLKSLGHDKVASVRTLDNLGRATTVETFVEATLSSGVITTDSGDLRAKSETLYDERGQTYRSIVHEVDANGDIDANQATDNWCDAAGRQIKTVGPDGLIHKRAYNGVGNVAAKYVVYDEGDCKDANNLDDDVLLSVTEYVYDAYGRPTETQVGMAVDGTTAVSKTYYDSSHNGQGTEEYRVTGVKSVKASDTATAMALTQYEYDANTGRRIAVISPDPDDGGDLPAIRTVTESDDLGRTTASYTYQDESPLDLISKVERTYENSRLQTVKRYNSAEQYLTTTYYYDGLGRTTKVQQASGAFTKTEYDDAGRAVATYLGSYEGDANDADTFEDDIIVEQTKYDYDPNGRIWLTTRYQREHDDTGEGMTEGKLTAANSRATYAAAWFDGLGRMTKSVNYGTNGWAVLDDPSDDFNPGVSGTQSYSSCADGMDPNSAASDYCIIATTEFDGFGRACKSTDNAGKITAVFFDDAGRRTHVVENFTDFAIDAQGDESGIGDANGSGDQDRVTKFTYNELGVLSQQIALDANSALNQATRYVYAFDLGDAGCTIARPELLRATIFPDSTDTYTDNGVGSRSIDGDDHKEYTYYCNGARKTFEDQRGVVHTYTYDDLGRLTLDAATDVPGQTYAVDQTVLSIGRAYDPNGALASITSFDDDAGGDEVNEIKYTRDAWGNITVSTQDPNGPAAVGTDPNVAYTWAYGLDGSEASYARLEKVTLPGGREVYYNYDSSDEFGALNRVANIAANGSPDPADQYVAYKYLGASMIVDANHPAVPGGLRLTYDPNADNAYDGFDRLGRTIDQRWARTDAADPNVDRFGYTYDRASNRLTRSQPLKPAYDETYEYDFLDRLRDANRPGDANGGQLDQSWTLRPTGNWESFTAGGVEQTRTHNNANEILTITADPNDPPDPLYGPAGCNVYGPKPNDDANGMHQRYDAWNRLATVYLDDGSQTGTLDGTDTLLATYRYDGLNRRVRKVVVGDDANTTTEHAYHNTGWQVLEIRRGLEGAAPTASAYKEYAYDIRYIDAPICRWWDGDGDGQMEPTAGEMHYYTNDAQFNATALIDANSGSVVERYMYDPYGKPTVLNGPADADPNTSDWTPDADNRSDHENEILYCGYRYDPVTGLYQVRERYYDPLTGTWKTRDKSGYVDGASLYEYCRSGPGGATDPKGSDMIPIGTGEPGGVATTPSSTDSLVGLRIAHIMRMYEKEELEKYLRQNLSIGTTSDSGSNLPAVGHRYILCLRGPMQYVGRTMVFNTLRLVVDDADAYVEAYAGTQRHMPDDFLTLLLRYSPSYQLSREVILFPAITEKLADMYVSHLTSTMAMSVRGKVGWRSAVWDQESGTLHPYNMLVCSTTLGSVSITAEWKGTLTPSTVVNGEIKGVATIKVTYRVEDLWDLVDADWEKYGRVKNILIWDDVVKFEVGLMKK